MQPYSSQTDLKRYLLGSNTICHFFQKQFLWKESNYGTTPVEDDQPSSWYHYCVGVMWRRGDKSDSNIGWMESFKETLRHILYGVEGAGFTVYFDYSSVKMIPLKMTQKERVIKSCFHPCCLQYWMISIKKLEESIENTQSLLYCSSLLWQAFATSFAWSFAGVGCYRAKYLVYRHGSSSTSFSVNIWRTVLWSVLVVCWMLGFSARQTNKMKWQFVMVGFMLAMAWMGSYVAYTLLCQIKMIFSCYVWANASAVWLDKLLFMRRGELQAHHYKVYCFTATKIQVLHFF